MQNTYNLLFSIIIIFLISISVRADIVYVDADATGANDGTSWADAYAEIHTALIHNSITPGNEVWVAEGIYLPSSSYPVFGIKTSLKVYGGFDGTETQRSQRNYANNETILSGNVGDPNSPLDNSSTLISFYTQEPNHLMVLDGFTLSDAYSESTVSRVFWAHNSSIVNIGLEVKIVNCIVKNNHCRIMNGSQFTFENCLFINNTGAHDDDHLLYFNNSLDVILVSHITNCTFFGNTATNLIYLITNVEVNFTNNIFWENEVEFTLKQNTFDDENTLNFNNNIISKFTLEGEIVYSLDTQNLLKVDPKFINPISQNFNLELCSPALDAGLSNIINSNKDLAGNNRISGIRIDLGAYERQLTAGEIFYVDHDAPGIEDGSNWANAFTDLQDAISEAEYGDEIWVAEGTYFPTDIADPIAKFIIPCGVKVYGGFNATEVLLSQRDFELNETILSGIIPGNTLTYHIVKFDQGNNETELDGFTLLAGNSSGAVNPNGGGIWAINFSGKINNCIFDSNAATKGGGIFLNDSDGASILNCSFIANNVFSQGGGAIFAKNSDFSIKRCDFTNNNLSPVLVEAGFAAFENCLFAGNINSSEGSAIQFDNNASGEITWCTFNFNLTGSLNRGAVHHSGNSGDATVSIINSIFWNNLDGQFADVNISGDPGIYTVRNCLVEGGFSTGINIIDEDPLFDENSENGSELSICSPALNAAIEIENTPLLDLDKKFRTIGSKPDLGAYEYRFPFSLEGYGGEDTISVCGGSDQLLSFGLQKNDTTFTEWDGANNYHGVMFEIRPKVPLKLTDVLIHHTCNTSAKHKVYYKEGNWSGSEITPGDWTDLMMPPFGSPSNCGVGDTASMIGKLTNPVVLIPEKKYSLYIAVNTTANSNLMRTHNDPTAAFGDLYLETEHFDIHHGRGISNELFGTGSAFSQIFEGGLIYQLYDSIEWKSGGQIISNEPEVIVSPTTDSTFKVKMYSVNGCSYTDKVFLDHSVVPDNNLCVTATKLFPNQPKIDGSTVCADPIGLLGTPCNAIIGHSVWYQFIAPGSGRIDILIKNLKAVNLPFFNVQVNVYRAPCPTLTYIDCVNDAGSLGDETLELNNLIEGETYYILVDAVGEQQGTFSIKIKDPCVGDFDNASELPDSTFLCDPINFDLSIGTKQFDTLVAPSMHDDTSSVIYFDVEALTSIRIDEVKCHLVSAFNFKVALYYRIGGHVGFEYDQSAWVYAGEETVSPNVFNGQVVSVGTDLNIFLEAGERVGFYIVPTTPFPIDIIHRNRNFPHLGEAKTSDKLILYKGYAGIGATPFAPLAIKFDPASLEGVIYATILDEVKWYNNGLEFSNEPDIAFTPSQSAEIVYQMDHVNGCVLKDTFKIDLEGLVVKNSLDEGLHSLRSVLGCISDNETATFHNTLNGDTIKLKSGQITINAQNSILSGLGMNNLAISGEVEKRIFRNHPNSIFKIENLSLIKGKSIAIDGGGAIKNEGILTVENCKLANNQTIFNGGAVWNSGQLTLRQSIFENNQAMGTGKAIYNAPGTSSILFRQNVTFK